MIPVITGPRPNARLEAKRCDLGGWVADFECPACGALGNSTIDGHFLSSPLLAAPVTVSANCDGCDRWLEFAIVIDITVCAASEVKERP